MESKDCIKVKMERGDGSPLFWYEKPQGTPPSYIQPDNILVVSNKNGECEVFRTGASLHDVGEVIAELFDDKRIFYALAKLEDRELYKDYDPFEVDRIPW